jgi:hypothetical protein
MALRNSQGQRKKYLTMELSSVSNFVENMCAIVSEFQSAKIGVYSLSCDHPSCINGESRAELSSP